MNRYEVIFIISPKLNDEETAAMVKKFQDLILENGTIEKIDEWGKRRLNYEIDFVNEGYYVLIEFTSKPDFPAELTRIFGITEGIMRSLVVAK